MTENLKLAGRDLFWPPADELTEAAERIRARLGDWPPTHVNWRICLTAPDTRHLAAANETVSAIYIWAIATTGRGIAGLGKAAAHLRQIRFRGADCYAQPSTVAGREIMKATGFEPISSFQPDLWCYERPWHRQPMRMPGAIIQARSYADARH